MKTVFLLWFQYSNQNDSSGVVCCGVIFLVVIVFLVVFVQAAMKDNKRQESLFNKARDGYFLSLAKLKKDPTNADLRQETLMLGRNYSELTRKRKGVGNAVTIYDEMALMNDINAACAGATVVSQKSEKSLTVEERLAKLSELKEKSLISEEEYETRRQKILDEI